MDLWIRSQKNNDILPTLIKVEEIKLSNYEKEINEVLQPKYTKIFPCLVANNCYNLGIYKTRERALEVLDEIQDMLLGGDFTPKEEDMILICGSARVYEMPEE